VFLLVAKVVSLLVFQYET
jgi:hypothetical protein